LFEEAWKLGCATGQDGFAVDAAHMVAIASDSGHVMEWNQKALALAEKSSDPKARRWRGSLYNNIGWDYFAQQKYDSALAMFEMAVPARMEQEQPAETRIAKWCVAKTLRMLGQVDSALVIQRALEVEWHDSDEGPDGYVFEEIAECLHSTGKTTDAKPYFARAYELLSADVWLQRDEPERLMRLKELGGVAE
jgi:tetratricopeptide (TPR) repeat protein